MDLPGEDDVSGIDDSGEGEVELVVAVAELDLGVFHLTDIVLDSTPVLRNRLDLVLVGLPGYGLLRRRILVARLRRCAVLVT